MYHLTSNPGQTVVLGELMFVRALRCHNVVALPPLAQGGAGGYPFFPPLPLN